MERSESSRRFGVFGCVLIITVFVCGVAARSASGFEVKATGWSAGAASVDITPTSPVFMAGYASRKTPSEGVTLPIHAKALVLRDAEGHSAVFITADLIGFDRALSATVTEQIKAKHGLPRASIALFASHTHTGPALKNIERNLKEAGLDPVAGKANLEYRKTLEGKLVAVVGKALSKLQPATLSYGVGRAEFAINRREKTPTGFKIGLNPNGPTDKGVPVLRVADSQDKLVAIVFGYACHNTTMTDKIMTISGDYAGFTQDAIEREHPGATALFVTGCAADANPNPRGTIELGKEHGRELAGAIEAVLAKPLKPLSGALRSAYAEPTLHFGGPTDRASYEARLKEPGTGRQAHARRMISLIASGKTVEAEYPYPVQAFAIGDGLTMLALAGEVVVDYSIRFQKELGGSAGDLWVAAYANDVFGYVPSLRVLNEGGYEGGEAFYYSTFPTPFAKDVEDVIAHTSRELVGQVRGAK